MKSQEKKINKQKIKNIAIIVLMLLSVLLMGFSVHTFNKLEDEKLKLSKKDAEVQVLNKELGLAKSDLLSVKDLNDKYEQEIEKFDEKLKKQIEEHDLQLMSRDSTIAALKTKLKGGKTKVVIVEKEGKTVKEEIIIEKEVKTPTIIDTTKDQIAYEWEEEQGRFKLRDPDIFSPDDETFEGKQLVRVLGHVFFGKQGQLQVKKVELQEVRPNGVDEEGNPKYVLVPGSYFELVDSNFEYTNNLPVKKKSVFDVITLRPLASFNTRIMPGIGMEWFNLGRIWDYVNIGLNTQLSADLTDPLNGSLQNSRVSIGLHYHLVPPFLDTNFAIGASVGVPFNDLRQPIFTIDVILFLTEDLNPMHWENWND